MEVQKGRGGIYPLAILFVTVMLLINAYCCAGAVVVVESNTTTVRYNGRVEESLIEYDLELEYLLNPKISRILVTPKPPVTGQSQDPNTACESCSDPCAKVEPYDRGKTCRN